MDLYYDRAGERITQEEWLRLSSSELYRRVALSRIGLGEDAVEVSTIWIGLNHSFTPESAPLIFETMIFGGTLDLQCWRYSTEELARKGHEAATRGVQGRARAR